MRDAPLPGWALALLAVLVIGSLLFAGQTEKKNTPTLDVSSTTE